MPPQSNKQNNFWKKLKATGEPFFALAPMADVTDPAFRRIIAKYGKPDVLWTEFVSADGLVLGGREKLLPDLIFTEAERPIVAQLFGSNPENMRLAVKLVAGLGFDGIDINMGCPDRSIEKQGAGALMIKTPEIAVSIIRSAKAGINDAIVEAKENGKEMSDIPLSVKTRIGYYKNEIDTWIPILLSENLSAITVHCRTRKEMSSVPARWEHLEEVVALRDKISPNTIIIGNGDIRDVSHGRELAKENGADGVMIGRAIFGNPWLFSELGNSTNNSLQNNPQNSSNIVHPKNIYIKFIKKYISMFAEIFAKFLQIFGFKNRYWLRAQNKTNINEKLNVLLEHCKLFEQLVGEETKAGKNFAVMKKHFKAYVHGWPGSKDLRMALMEARNSADVEEIIKKV